jgi:integrase
MAQKTKYDRWKVRWRDYANGIMRSKNFDLKRDAERFEAELKLGRALGQASSANQTTFQDFANRWYEEHCLVHKSKSQQVEDRRVICQFLLPAFGGVDLNKLKRYHLQQLQQSLVAEKLLKPKTINNITCLAKKILNDAVAWDVLEASPFHAVRKLPVPKQPFQCWERDELKRFLTYCKPRDPELWQLVVVAANTGMRIGELELLYRDSVDFDSGFIVVRRSYIRRVDQESQTTKGKEHRFIDMNDSVKEALADKMLLAPNQLIFPYSVEMMSRWRLKTMCKKAGVSRIGMHGLRHTFLTHLAYAGISPYEIQRVAGHKDLTTTLRYIHYAQSRKSLVAQALEATVPPSVPRQGKNSYNVSGLLENIRTSGRT